MNKRFWRQLLVLACIASFSLSIAVPAAGRTMTSLPPAAPSPFAPDVDDGLNEVGVEWDTDSGTRPYWENSATGLYDWMVSGGWSGNFKWANSLAWEEDFKSAASGGTENTWIDSVDLALVGTHGSGAWDSFWGTSLSSVWFSTSHDDQHLSPGEAYLAYGDGDLEWLAFDSCSVLQDGSIAYWATAFNGLHLLHGFANTMYVGSPGDGYYWGYLMAPKPWCFFCPILSVTQSWFIGTDWNQPSGVRARVLAEELDNYNDYAWGTGGYVSPDYPPDDDFFWWDHLSGTPDPLQLDGPITSLPVYQVVPRVVDQNYVQSIGASLGMAPEVYASPDGMYYFMTGASPGTAEGGTNDLLVMVTANTGSFYYLDTNALWKDPPEALPASDDEAREMSLSFLAAHDSLPGVFDFDQTITPTAVLEGQGMGIPAQPSLAGAGVINPMNYAVSYGRTAEVNPGQYLSIVGPGSRQNVYIGGNNEVVGIVGGWRDVEMVAGSSVPIKPSDQVWNEFLADPGIAIPEVPMADVYDLNGNPAPTLAYYEQPTLLGQAELIPVWVFVADLYVEPNEPLALSGLIPLVTDASIYLPASDAPDSSPQAVILTPSPGTNVLPGDTVDLSGMGSGGAAPLTYEWSSDVDGYLGSGPTLNSVLLSPSVKPGELSANIVTLTVTDANSQSATATVEIWVANRVVLPLILRN